MRMSDWSSDVCSSDLLDPGLVTGDARKQALLGPAAVAVHDDSDMARAVVSYRHAKALNPVRIERSRDAHRGRARSMGVSTSLDTNGQSAIATHYPRISFSLAVAASSKSAIVASVSFWTSVSSRLLSSSLISFLFSSSFR